MHISFILHLLSGNTNTYLIKLWLNESKSLAHSKGPVRSAVVHYDDDNQQQCPLSSREAWGFRARALSSLSPPLIAWVTLCLTVLRFRFFICRTIIMTLFSDSYFIDEIRNYGAYHSIWPIGTSIICLTLWPRNCWIIFPHL